VAAIEDDVPGESDATFAQGRAGVEGGGAQARELPRVIMPPASVPLSVTLRTGRTSSGVTLTNARVAGCAVAAGACYLLSLLTSSSSAARQASHVDRVALVLGGSGRLARS